MNGLGSVLFVTAMLKHFRTLVTYGLILSSVLGSLFVAGFLQEFPGDGLRKRIKEAGLSLPLEEPWIEVSLQRMALTLYDGDVMIRRFDIGYGKGPVGRCMPGQQSTPIGEYRIIAKQKRQSILSRGSRFLILDFPSELDALRAFDQGAVTPEEVDRICAADRNDEIPPGDTGLGGPLGIQGNFFFFMDRRFTDGSVALSNGDLNELYEVVPVGTRVVIQVN